MVTTEKLLGLLFASAVDRFFDVTLFATEENFLTIHGPNIGAFTDMMPTN